jgi:hypothetical protein
VNYGAPSRRGKGARPAAASVRGRIGKPKSVPSVPRRPRVTPALVGVPQQSHTSSPPLQNTVTQAARRNPVHVPNVESVPDHRTLSGRNDTQSFNMGEQQTRSSFHVPQLAPASYVGSCPTPLGYAPTGYAISSPGPQYNMDTQTWHPAELQQPTYIAEIPVANPYDGYGFIPNPSMYNSMPLVSE